MRHVVLVLVLVVAATAAAVSAPAKPLRAACTAGVHPFGDVSARTFCGPAKATLVVGGRTIRFQGGSCQRGPAYVSLNIGTVVLGTTTKPRPDYFGLNVGKVPIFGGTPATHDGLLAKSSNFDSDHSGGTVMPFLMSWWRCPITCKSTVSTSAEHFAAMARSISDLMKPRSFIT